MTKWMIIASTAFVWTAGFAATAGLAYVARSPEPIPIVRTESAVVAKMPPPVTLAKTMPVAENRVVVLPTVEIVGTAPPKPKADPPPAAKPAQRDISEMHCSEFRPLEQGSSSVQICD